MAGSTGSNPVQLYVDLSQAGFSLMMSPDAPGFHLLTLNPMEKL